MTAQQNTMAPQTNNNPLINQLDGIIFDLDGTLVDASLDFALMREQVGCPEGVDMLKFIDTKPDPDERRRCHALVIEHEMRDAKQSQWLPGAKSLVTKLHNLSRPQAIVTRNCHQASQIKICNNDIPIQTVLSRENYPPKPAPDALLAIAEQWCIDPGRLMYVGDFLYDVQAGNNAGMLSCLITHGKNMAYGDQANHVFASLEELASALFGNFAT